MWKLQAKIYLRQNKDYSLGDSTSDSSEKLLQRSRWEDWYLWDFVEGGIHAVKHIFFQKVYASFMKLLLVMRNSCHCCHCSSLRILVFLDVRKYKNQSHISSWNYLKTYPASFSLVQSGSLLISTLNSFQGVLKVAAAVVHDLILIDIDG